MIASLIFAIAGLLTSVTGLIVVLDARRKIGAVHGEVSTLNGKTIGVLADNAEGRRILETIPLDKQTSHDKAYIEALSDRDKQGTPEGTP